MECDHDDGGGCDDVDGSCSFILRFGLFDSSMLLSCISQIHLQEQSYTNLSLLTIFADSLEYRLLFTFSLLCVYDPVSISRRAIIKLYVYNHKTSTATFQ